MPRIPPPSTTLFTRLRQALLGLALAPLLLGFGTFLVSYGISEHRQLMDQYQRRVLRIGERIEFFLYEAQEHLGLAQRFWNYGALPATEQRRILQDILAGYGEFLSIEYLDARGEQRLRVSRHDIGDQPMPHRREQEAVARTLAAEAPSFGKVEIDPATGEPLLLMALPVKDPFTDRMTGILVTELTLKGVWRDLGEMTRGTTDDVLVLSAERRVIAHVNPSTVLAGTRYAAPDETGVARDLNDRPALVAVHQVKLPGNTLTVVLTRTLVSAYAVGLFQLGAALLILLLAMALALALLRRIRHWLIDPIMTLTDAARRIREDEKDVRVRGAFRGEVAALADTFNLMLDRLHAEQDALEQRVERRTRDLVAARDQVTEARAMLLAVLDTIPIRIFWKDRNLVYLGCNTLFARDAGKASPQEVIGRTDHDMGWREQAEIYRADDQRVIESGQAKIGYEEPQSTPGGSTIWLRTSKVPLRDTAGSVIGVLGVYEDITDEKQVEMVLRAAKEAAEQASQAKSLFLSSMSHELRTPLNAILGYAQLLEMSTDLPADAAESAKEIHLAGRHLLDLVNDILDLARIEAGRVEFQLEDLMLDPVLAECLSQNLPRAAEQRVSLEADASCAGRSVRADRRRLLQVLNNLVSNAIKYNRPGGQVRVNFSALGAGRCRISVSDTGTGMQPEQLSQLFQPFSRAGAEMSTIEGTGIGLVITRDLVIGMGGEIGVNSTPGQGSTFWIELPVPAGAAADAPLPPAAPPAVAASAAGQVQVPAGTRVLVAEDYAPNQTVLRLQLQTLGCVVDIAADGAEALLKWRQQPYALILSDLNMPVMDGLALARAVRESEAAGGGHTPIIAITAAAVQSELQRCRDAGMDDVLTKPLSMDGLGAALQRWVQGAAPAPVVASHDAASSATLPDPVFDVQVLYDVLGVRDPVLAQELLGAFLLSAAQGLDALDRVGSDNAALGREMHKQKASARTAGALRYARQVEQLEAQAHEGAADVAGAVGQLRRALAEVEQAMIAASLTPAAAPAAPLPQVPCKSLLVVDDDMVVLKQLPTLLAGMGVGEVLTAGSGLEAIMLVGQRVVDLEVVLCDLNMPQMDGVELIRRFGQTGFRGGLILMSGADPQILNTAAKLAELQGLRVLGQLAKPVMPADLAAALTRLQEQVPARRQAAPRPALKIEAQDIREAMARDEFTVWFQPKVDARTLRPNGLESLARWRRPDGSFVPPDIFITLAEREGIIGELSRLLTVRALQEVRHVYEAGHPLKLAVNLSGTWLDDLHLPEIVQDMAREAGIKPRDLVLEVTETGVMEDLTTALDVLTRLRLKGFGLSIDDFGIGYSSFEQLGRIPFTEMKLDRSFVTKGSRDAAARAILESSMGMAQKLGLTTVAEGVETQEDLELVRAIGCDSVQGYLVAKPMPVDELIVWLNRTAAQ